jgi:hypothetical protein
MLILGVTLIALPTGLAQTKCCSRIIGYQKPITLEENE